MNRYQIEPLQVSHVVEAFDCGEEPLNRFLVRFALANQRANASRTYVAPGEVSPEQAPERIRKGLARHPIPLLVLARLAVAVEHQGRGLGAGIRALAVHANDEWARGFYETFGLRPSPTDPLHIIQLHVAESDEGS